MDFLYNESFGWCFVLGEIVVVFIVFMVVHRWALRHHEGLLRSERSGDRPDDAGVVDESAERDWR
jgi:hypothetical protein